MGILILGFTENILKVLRLNDSKEIILKDRFSLSFNINDETYLKRNHDELISEFSGYIFNILKNESPEENTASVVIDTAQTFLNVIPVDFNEDHNNINSHILWELSNYFPEKYKDFKIKYYRLNNNNRNEGIDDVLLIAIDNNKINFIKKLCNASNVKIKNIEIDQFAVEKCLKENYKSDILNKNILIIGCKNSRLDYSLISNEELKYYNYDLSEVNNYKTSLVKQMNFFNYTFSNKTIGHIFLYGNENLDNVKNFLEVEFPNLKISTIDSLGLNDSSFASLYGLALKNI